MENFIGKTCPFCKTEIKEGEEIKVCPACGIPHHIGCWEENKGCTTFGCSEQHYEEQGTNPSAVCSNCGTPLGDGQDFCPKCGTRKEQQMKNTCSNCGAELADGQEFCGKCGTKVAVKISSEASAAIDQFNANITKKKQKPKVIPIIAICVAVLIGVLLIPKLLVTPEKLMEKGDYITAYEKASSDEKSEIEAANAVAVCSAKCVDSLKDSDSFELREAWYNPTTYGLTLKVAANNSYGNKVINYWYYSWDSDDEEYCLFASVADLDDEKSYSWDDTDEKLEKILNNAARSLMRNMMTSKYEISSENVDNINNLFESGLLDDVKLISLPREKD